MPLTRLNRVQGQVGGQIPGCNISDSGLGFRASGLGFKVLGFTLKDTPKSCEQVFWGVLRPQFWLACGAQAGFRDMEVSRNGGALRNPIRV